MLFFLDKIDIKNHEILGDLNINFVNKKTGHPYKVIAFVGENGCGKTTLLNELSKLKNHHHIFIRQNNMFVGAYNEAMEMLAGKDLLIKSRNDEDLVGGQNAYALRANNIVNNKQRALKLLNELGDQKVNEVFSSGKIDRLIYSSLMTKILFGEREGFKLEELSSGQQEVLMKLKELKQTQAATDYVLLDEPEASLHPIWQLKIVQLCRELLTDSNENAPQLFIATHSEKILESLINEEDTLIVRLFRNNGVIKSETINQMDLRLPKTTFAELDYVVFNIDSFEYCSQLYDLIEWKTGDGERLIDKRIRSSEFYNEKIHYKEWFNEKYQNVTSHNIATYCRNYFHHPKDREKPTLEQLHEAIELLRNVVLNLE